jgi:hypothetical protein
MGARGLREMPENEWRDLALAWRAAARYGARDAAQRLQSAWGEGTLQARGIRSTIPETDEVVEIPASEAGRLTFDCPRSHIVLLSSRGRRKLTYYHSVEVRTAADERLAQQARQNRTPAATAAQQSQLAEQVDDERLAREAETDASPPCREDADASVGEAGAGDAPAREEEAAPPTTTPASEAQQSAAKVVEMPAYLDTALVRREAAVVLQEWPNGPDKNVDEMLQHLHDKFPKTKIGRSKTTLERSMRRLKLLGKWGE